MTIESRRLCGQLNSSRRAAKARKAVEPKRNPNGFPFSASVDPFEIRHLEAAIVERFRWAIEPHPRQRALTGGWDPRLDMLHKRVHYDLEYVDNWSFSMDIGLIIRTAWQVFFPPKSAY